MNLEREYGPNPYEILPQLPHLEVWSDDVADGQPLGAAQTAQGGSISPHLAWEAGPEGTRSYAVSMFDPDAPTASGFWHWMLVDIPADVTELPAGAGSAGGTLPEGAFMLRNDGGTVAFTGANPPAGDHQHRYYIAVHAVGARSLGVARDASLASVGFNLTFHSLARGWIMGTAES
ncbi:YbhB/YbcL family Raf kinase inhibitor-like protein [Neoactinobaculum massilliense]|uniref:YbhB/YbcL family Raf kinase inhibitor-like protein n=1 Tax=Neoactinobaculum massilliense TaxID=2364794 RepID=UPI000F544103|nr:YbhB/YbcL family Raf kinase inhibitor-like protein [Neoactinobaculum massilliense]